MKYILFFIAIINLNVFAKTEVISANKSIPPHMRCKMPRSQACEKFVNSKISRWDRNDDSVQRKLVNACAGNESNLCVKNSALTLPWYNVENTEDMLRVATSCKLTRMDCVRYVKSKLSKRDYDSVDELYGINFACARADAYCVNQACDSRRYDCSRKDGLLRAAESCFESCFPR